MMSPRLPLIATVAAAVVVLGATATPAAAETQPANLENVANADRGNSLFGPHCHAVTAFSGTASGFTEILTGAAHQAHRGTGQPNDNFEARPCG